MSDSTMVDPSVDPSATQPGTEGMLDDKRFALALAELEASPRVRLETIGRSHEGRPITLIIAGNPEALANLDRHTRLTDHPEELSAGGAVPIVFAGDSWGHEASQVEGLIKAAQVLAFDQSDEVEQALSRTVALLIPLINPDGRAAALREWQKTPLSNGDSGAGNAYGFLLNRDFVHGTQPEAKAVIETVMRWRPAAVVDLHEDMFSLGIRFPEVCFVEPFAEGFDVEEHPLTRGAIIDLGDAISARWREHGFKAAYDAGGDNVFAPLPEPGKGLNPVANSAGRLNLMSTLHGIPSFITESARTPGTQTWEDRVEQKSAAVLATLAEVSARPERYLNAVHQRREAETADAGSRFLLIPEEDQPRDGLTTLLSLLELHGVGVHKVASPYPALVVFLAQREARVARHLLLGERSKLNEAPPALGVRIVPSESLSKRERFAVGQAIAEPALVAPPAPPDSAAAASTFSTLPTVRSTALVNQLLLSGSARAFAREGRLHFSGSKAAIRWSALQLGVPLEQVTSSGAPEGRELSSPRIGLYTGQGVPHQESGEVAWALEQGGFSYHRIEAGEMAEGALSSVKVLLVPNGSAADIVNGWNPNAPNRRAPWQVSAPSQGIADAGLEAIRAFVQAGGTYIGLGGGGALLAGKDHLGISSAEMISAEVGLGQVRLKAVQPDSPLLFGYRTDGPLSGFFSAPPGSPQGGYAFRGGSAVALYDGVREFRGELSFTDAEALSAAAGNAAIVHEQSGRGQVALFGIAPAFRGQWRSTFGLLYNAVYLGTKA